MATGNRNVICIPSKPCRTLSEAVKYYICALIPKGKVLTEKTFEEFVAAKLGVEHVMFSSNLWDKMKNVENILQYDRTYRLVSNVGRVSNVHVEKLAQEGFTLRRQQSICLRLWTTRIICGTWKTKRKSTKT